MSNWPACRNGIPFVLGLLEQEDPTASRDDIVNIEQSLRGR
jgi:hypothetical protein